MPWTYYKSTDAGAPVLTGQVGSLITVLDACLVNGFGSKSPAGWTKSFTGTNKAAYRMGSGLLQGFFRILDDGTPTAGAKEARLWLYESMADVDTGSNAVIGGTGYHIVRKSETADGVARSWQLVGDDRTFILMTNPNSTGLNFVISATYVGQLFSFLPNDPYNFAVIARFLENSATYNSTSDQFTGTNSASAFGSLGGHYVARDTTGIWKQRAYSKISGLGATGGTGSTGPFMFPNPADGGLILSPFYARDSEPSGQVLRGRYRGMWAPGHAYSTLGLNPAETFSGTGDWAGKTFINGGYCGESSMGGVIIEVSDTVPRN